MRKLLLALPLLLFWACTQKDVVTIEGKISHAEGKTLYFDKLHVSSTEKIDSIEIGSDGKFKFKTKNKQPGFYLLRLSSGKLITLLAEPNEKIVLIINGEDMPSDYAVEGSKGSELVKELNAKLLDTKRKVADIRAKMSDPNSSKILQDLQEEYVQVINGQREFSADFIMKNATSFASYMALYQQLDENTFTLNENDDIKFIKAVASSMIALYPEHEYTKAILTDLTKLENRLSELKIRKLIEEKGTNFPNISLPNVKGEEVELSSLTGKFIVLSYWAAQDPTSRKQNKTLRKVYDKYHKRGLEIYHVSVDKDKNLWKRAILQDQLNWINVCDPSTGSANAVRMFNVQRIPANYLIDKKGQIVGKNLFGIALEEKVAEYF